MLFYVCVIMLSLYVPRIALVIDSICMCVHGGVSWHFFAAGLVSLY